MKEDRKDNRKKGKARSRGKCRKGAPLYRTIKSTERKEGGKEKEGRKQGRTRKGRGSKEQGTGGTTDGHSAGKGTADGRQGRAKVREVRKEGG